MILKMLLLRFTLLVCSALMRQCSAVLPPPDRPLNVLMLLPISSKSHLFMFLPAAKALADRGHKITIVDNDPMNIEMKNVQFVRHNISRFNMSETDFVTLGSSYLGTMKHMTYNLYKFAEEFYESKEIAQLYRERDKFDVIFVDYFTNEVAYPFAYGKILLTMSITGQDPIHSASVGNFLNPAYVSHTLDNLANPMSLTTRTFNLIMTFASPIFRYLIFILPVQLQINKIFPEIPVSLLDIERNQSVAFLNSHFSMFDQTRMLPNQIEMGGVHCKPGKPLPKELNDFLSGDDAVIYISFGTALSAKCIPQQWKDALVAALKKLPYKVIWKFDEIIPNLSKNILQMNWTPQQDVLAHPNLKLYVSHGGMMGTQESIYHATPLLALPIFTDQHKNANRIQNLGIGLTLDWADATEYTLQAKITEIITNNKYKDAISKMSALFRDQQESPVERIVYWTEYAVRHKGARHMRSPELDLNWIQFLSLDILATVLFVLYLTYRLFKYILRSCLKAVFSNK